MIQLKTKDEIEELRRSALMVGDVLAEVSKHIRPGVATKRLDEIAEDYIRSFGAIPTFKGYCGYPASLCISINDVVVHGIPGERVVKEGDIVSIDCGVTLNGWVGDSAYTFALAGVEDEVMKLCRVTKESLYIGIEQCTVSKRLGDLGYHIQDYCQSFGYGVVRELCGHGVGRHMHEEPSVPNYGKRGNGTRFREGMTIAVEPMITLGKKDVLFEADQWTCRTVDHSPAAHYEHDIAITESGPDILSSFDKIEEAVKTNINLEQI
ncbi:MAG TPA: type I methionyl aminopeptidase [Candidatus Onthomorpha intestinigallinarum]|uniref:Methionine aminopeptidase n=1 Tax=Candidatus Onthomorpha intestinigallinarum TaxID=2840880 RepID=A0A9D1RG21_9BACT|nr:type I methionyl aminopeptidase [Candidatus Onthomorpha intestinigallinarum]